MKRLPALLLCVALLLFTALSPAHAQDLTQPLSRAMADLKVVKDDPGLLVLTNAPYVNTGGKNSLFLLDQAQNLTGATVGRGNLLFFQRPPSHPFRLMLFKKSDRRAAVITGNESGWATDMLALDPKTISDPLFWKTAKDKYTAGQDLFTLTTIASAWAEGAPYDFLKAAELHNHICPGLTSGYLMAHYILDHYPLSPGERYTILASPVWCKEDAFQLVMDCTPGKRGLVVKPLSESQKKKITVPDPAGFLLIWNQKEKKGKAVALSFDFYKLKALYPEKTPKAASILYTVPHFSTPEKFVSAAREFSLDEALYTAMCEAGTNPYAAAGLTAD